MIVIAFRGYSPGITTSVGHQTVACPAQGCNQRLANDADGISWPTPCPLFVRGTLALMTIALFIFFGLSSDGREGCVWVCVGGCVCVCSDSHPIARHQAF